MKAKEMEIILKQLQILLENGDIESALEYIKANLRFISVTFD